MALESTPGTPAPGCALEPVLTQSAWFRTHNRDDQIRNLYFVGAGTHPGAGVPGVVNGAKATWSVIERDFAHRLAGAGARAEAPASAIGPEAAAL